MSLVLEFVCKSGADVLRMYVGDEGTPIVHAPLSRVYKDSLIAIASYTVGQCDDRNSIAVATNAAKFEGWITQTSKHVSSSYSTNPGQCLVASSINTDR